MAIESASAQAFEQAHLENLPADSDLRPRTPLYHLPDMRSLDSKAIEIIVDLDLDDMLLYFYGRSVSHDVEPQSELVSYLVEADSDRVVGVIIHEFMIRAVKEYPQLAEAMRWAIIVSGTESSRHPTVRSISEASIRNMHVRGIGFKTGSCAALRRWVESEPRKRCSRYCGQREFAFLMLRHEDTRPVIRVERLIPIPRRAGRLWGH